MYAETNLLDFINHECLSSDVSVAFLETPIWAFGEKAQGDPLMKTNVERCGRLTQRYAHASLSHSH